MHPNFQTARRAVCLSLLMFLTCVVAVSQTKVIQWSDHPQGSNAGDRAMPPLQLFKQIDAIEIEEVRVEGTPVTIGAAFTASPDWLNNLTFRVKNLTDRSLMALQITLTLPQIQKSPQIPYIVTGCTNLKKVCVHPGEEVELRLPAVALYNWVKKIVAEEKQDMTAIDKATIYSMIATLDDGTQWSSGCVKTADPRNACPRRAP